MQLVSSADTSHNKMKSFVSLGCLLCSVNSGVSFRSCPCVLLQPLLVSWYPMLQLIISRQQLPLLIISWQLLLLLIIFLLPPPLLIISLLLQLLLISSCKQLLPLIISQPRRDQLQ